MPNMLALILEKPGQLVLREVPIPEPKAGEILVHVRAATTCGTDLKAFLRGHPQIPMPGVFGHEYAGVVERVGEGAKFREGDEVMGVHSAPCQHCSWCLNGQENLCESIMATKVLGSFAEYLLIPERIANLNLHPKPKEIDFFRASLLEPLACVVQALSDAKRIIGDRSHLRWLILGPGAVGLLFVAAIKYLGLGHVDLAGRNRVRLAVGESLGANILKLTDIQNQPQYDVGVECVGLIETWQAIFQSTKRGGLALLFGGCPKGTVFSLDSFHLHYDQVSILSPFHFGTQAVKTARDWLLDKAFSTDGIISSVRPLVDGIEVFEQLRHGQGIKVALQP